jgi:hypothetical protein
MLVADRGIPEGRQFLSIGIEMVLPNRYYMHFPLSIMMAKCPELRIDLPSNPHLYGAHLRSNGWGGGVDDHGWI